MKGKISKKVKKAILMLTVAIYSLTMPIQSYALAETTLVKGATKLIEDFTGVLILVVASLTAAAIIFYLIKYKTGSEEEKPKNLKNVKTTLIAGVVAMCTTGLVTAIFSYFK